MSAEQSSSSSSSPAARLPVTDGPRRRSLRPDDVPLLAPEDREAVEALLALPALDGD